MATEEKKRQRKSHTRPNRTRDTIKTENLKTWKAEDSQEGVTRVTFPTFRVNQEDLEEINDYCDRAGESRPVLMRRLIREFLDSQKKQ